MRRLILITLLSVHLIPTVYSQEEGLVKLILMQGVVMDAGSQAAIPNAHVILNGERGQATDEYGKFSLYISELDTLVISHLGYIDKVFILSDTLPGSAFVAGIFMKTDITAVGEVVIMPRITDLKTQIRSSSPGLSPQMKNAQKNITASAYQGLTTGAELGDPATNYELLKRKQMQDAYEKGGIPSDKMIALNPITFIPAVIYLAANGLPQRPAPPKPMLTQQELNRIKEIYRKRQENN